MNDAWVIDSSIGFAWIHPNQATADTDGLLEQVEAGATLVVPSLWFAEIANGLLILQRRKKLTPSERKEALAALSKLNFTVDEDAVRTVLGRTSELAEKHDLTVYDAIYLELALRRNLPLASRNRALANAARKAGVRVL